MVEIPATGRFTDWNPWTQVRNLIFFHLKLTSDGKTKGQTWNPPSDTLRRSFSSEIGLKPTLKKLFDETKGKA